MREAATGTPQGTAITQEQRTNAVNQRWVYIGTLAQNNPIQIQNVGIGVFDHGDRGAAIARLVGHLRQHLRPW